MSIPSESAVERDRCSGWVSRLSTWLGDPAVGIDKPVWHRGWSEPRRHFDNVAVAGQTQEHVVTVEGSACHDRAVERAASVP